MRFSISRPSLQITGAIAGIGAACGGGIFYVVGAVQAQPPAPYLQALIWLSAVTVVLLVGCLYLSGWHVFNARKAKLADQHLSRFDSVVRELNRILAIDYRFCTFLSGAETATAGEVKERSDRYLEEVLTHTAEVFRAYTGAPCAASAKAFSASTTAKRQIRVQKDREPSRYGVFTLARDQASREARGVVDDEDALKIYPYAFNTAFKTIMHDLDARGYYAANQLQKLGPKYKNANPRWTEFYDAVAVTALKNPCKSDLTRSIGFLCVDNKAGGFDESTCRELLECIASIIYYSLRKTASVLDSKEELAA